MRSVRHGESLPADGLAGGQRGPRRLVVGLDRRHVLGQGELEAAVAVDVAVGDVVGHLADGPAAGAVFGVELRVGEPGDAFGDEVAEQAGAEGQCDECGDRSQEDRNVTLPQVEVEVHLLTT